MRILIISTYFPPLNSIASHRPYSWAKYWAMAGHEVTVLTTAKEIDPNTALKLPLTDFKVLEVPLPSFLQGLKNKGLPKRRGFLSQLCTPLLNYLRFKKGILNACRMPDLTAGWVKPALAALRSEKAWDLVVSTAGPYTTHLVGHQLKKEGRAKKWIADYRDPWSDNYLYPGLPLVRMYETTLEERLLKAADLITTVSVPLTAQFAKRFGQHRVATVENGFDFEEARTVREMPLFAQDGKFRIVHTGSLYPGKRDPTVFFKALQKIACDPQRAPLLENLEVIFVGHRQANLEELIALYGVEKWVKQIGQVDHETALQMQREAHALLFFPWNDPLVDGILTGKIFEYLGSRTRILAVGCPEFEASQKLILEAEAGVRLPSSLEVVEFLTKALEKPIKIPAATKDAVLHPFERQRLAMKLLSYVQKPAKIAVIIVTYNSEGFLSKAMNCLQAQSRPADKIILVDTGSKDRSYLDAYRVLPKAEVVFAEKEAGFCRGNNVGLQYVPPDYDYVFFLNPDAFITPHYLKNAEEALKLNPHLGAVTGPTWGYSLEQDAPTGLYDTTGVFKTWYGRWYDRAQGQPIGNPLEEETLPAICGAVFFCRKAALHSVLLGPDVFDSSFYMYKEDVDLSLRLRKKGWELRLIPSLTAYHCRGWKQDRSLMPRLFRLLSAKNEWRINLRSKNPIALLYSSLKWAAVSILDI